MKYERTAAQMAAHIAIRIAEVGAYIVILACIVLAWIGTPS